MADFVGVEDLVDQEELQDAEQFNPKSKTTNMSSLLKQINKSNVNKLQMAWSFSTGVLRGHEGGPLVIGDTLYVHSAFPNKVFAINLADQTIKWKYEPKQENLPVCSLTIVT